MIILFVLWWVLLLWAEVITHRPFSQIHWQKGRVSFAHSLKAPSPVSLLSWRWADVFSAALCKRAFCKKFFLMGNKSFPPLHLPPAWSSSVRVERAIAEGLTLLHNRLGTYQWVQQDGFSTWYWPAFPSGSCLCCNGPCTMLLANRGMALKTVVEGFLNQKFPVFTLPESASHHVACKQVPVREQKLIQWAHTDKQPPFFCAPLPMASHTPTLHALSSGFTVQN